MTLDGEAQFCTLAQLVDVGVPCRLAKQRLAEVGRTGNRRQHCLDRTEVERLLADLEALRQRDELAAWEDGAA
jgi:hypothetical protein